MKKQFLFAFLLLAGLITQAGPDKPVNQKSVIAPVAPEDNGSKFNIGISVGTTIPLQNYGDKTNNPDTTRVNGYAKTGFHYNVTVGYKFSKYIGGMLLLGGSVNAYSPDVAVGGSYGTLSPSGPHYVGQYLIGPYASFPIGNKFSIEVRALVGLVTSSYPKLSENASASFGGFSFGGSYEAKFKSGAAFGYSGGVGGKYMLTDHIGLTLNAGYTGSNMVYKSYTVTQSTSGIYASNSTTTTNKDTHMSIGMINITAGVVFGF